MWVILEMKCFYTHAYSVCLCSTYSPMRQLVKLFLFIIVYITWMGLYSTYLSTIDPLHSFVIFKTTLYFSLINTHAKMTEGRKAPGRTTSDKHS